MARGSSVPVLLGLGGLGLGIVVLAASTSGGRQAARRVADEGARVARRVEAMIEDWMHALLTKTSEYEGYYWTVQPNHDGQGASYGILQWTQKRGGLGGVLRAMYAADPAGFEAAMDGPENARAILQHTAAKSMDPLLGADLWKPPWIGRLSRAGGPVPALPPRSLPRPATKMQEAMYQHAATSEYADAARKVAQLLNLSTERAMALYFDRAVQQGPDGATEPAQEVAAYYATDPSRRPATDAGVLAQYAWQAARHFRTTTEPASLQRSKDTVWKRFESESDLSPDGHRIARNGTVWHAVEGPFDLWENVLKRASGIILDPGLRDGPVDLSRPIV